LKLQGLRAERKRAVERMRMRMESLDEKLRRLQDPDAPQPVRAAVKRARAERARAERAR
jgi:hypothetical protein